MTAPTILVHVRARCGCELPLKHGHASNGAQRARCLDCKCPFILEPAGSRHDQKLKDRMLAAYQDA